MKARARVYRLGPGAWVLQLTPTSKWVYPTHDHAMQVAEVVVYRTRRHQQRIARAA